MYTSFMMITQWILAGLGVYFTARALWIKADMVAASETEKRRERALALGLLLALVFALVGPVISQAPYYNEFSDARSWQLLPHATNVLSNGLFGLFGVIGLWAVRRAKVHGWEKQVADLFFIGLVLTAIYSSFYHLAPDNNRLVYDRLGIAIAIAGLVGVAVFQRISARAARVVAVLFYWGGMAAVWRWDQTGNLTSWVAVQGAAMVLLFVLIFVAPRDSRKEVVPLLPIVVCYTVSKIFELEDAAIFAWTQGAVSGHTLKHIAAAFAAWPVVAAYLKRRDGKYGW